MKCKKCGKEFSEPVFALHSRRCKVEKEVEKEIDVEQYHTGRGWYEYEGKSYRKDDLIERLGE